MIGVELFGWRAIASNFGVYMKEFKNGEKSKGICNVCGLVEIEFKKRDTNVSGLSEYVKDILVGVCSKCDHTVSSPQQSATKVEQLIKKISKDR
jgi:hypothetical protein